MKSKASAAELPIGAHTSAAGGVFNALLEGKQLGATTIQLFTANQRQWKGAPLPADTIAKWKEVKKETGLSHIMSHDSYLINLGAPDAENLTKSRATFATELTRCHQLDLTYLNFHPGAALKEDRQLCLDRIVESLKLLEPVITQGNTRLLFEATAGQGSAVGCTFEELAYLIEATKDLFPVGICIDTCHIFVAGYDLRTAEACDKTFKDFDRIVGLKWLHAFHMNDSKKGLGSRVDRHEQLGKGEIGIECFKWLMTDPRTRELPKYLETPDRELWAEEIQMLRSFAETSK
ncbi:MAG: deoxyribonuclease IV [Chlamydiales bacterium]|nr:deoxyribonuclease IV [Chlamydiales bacterium]